MPSPFSLDLAGVSAPTLPDSSWAKTGTWVTENDGTANRLRVDDASATIATLPMYAANRPTGTTTFSFDFLYADQAALTNSYVFPGVCRQMDGSAYQVVLSRGTGESRGALWVQKNIVGGGNTDLGSPTYVGASGTTFERNKRYVVTVAFNPITGGILFAVQVRRVNDGLYLNGSGAWVSGVQTALTVSDTSSPLPITGSISLNVFATSVDAVFYAVSQDNQSPQAIKYASNPVITKGATYNSGGWTADADAAPGGCWDGTRYVGQISAWDNTKGKWGTAILTAASRAGPWTEASGSFRSPTGSDYIFGNGDIEWFAGKYFAINAHYPSASPSSSAGRVEYSTDLQTWTPVGDAVIPATSFDHSFSVNPTTGRLEAWFVVGSTFATREVHMWDTSDGTTPESWTDRGAFLACPDFIPQNFGEPTVWYVGGTRYLACDGAYVLGYRVTHQWHSDDQSTDWVYDGIILMPHGGHPAESGSVFDCEAVTDTGNHDGLGATVFLYAMSDLTSSTDNTDSSIGLATPAAAAPVDLSASPIATAGSTTIDLDAGASGGTAPYDYTWTCTAHPTGATVTFDDATSATPTATVNKAGDYTFEVTVEDSDGATDTQTASATVTAAHTTTAFPSSTYHVPVSKTRTFTAYAYDQFGEQMASQPAMTYSVTAGSSTIDSSTGAFTANDSPETATIQATAGGHAGTATVDVVTATNNRRTSMGLGIGIGL